MMKKLILFLLITTNSFADITAEKKELMDLLKTRTELFQAYSSSLQKKSGLFGNRTKNDLKESHDQLKAIVEQDNLIMNVLQRTIQYKTFEKTTMNYDVNEYVERIKNLNIVNDTLQKELRALQAEIKQVKKEKRNLTAWGVGLLLVMGAVVVIRERWAIGDQK